MKNPYVSLMAGVTCIGIAPILVHLIEAGPATIGMLRTLIGGLCLIPVILLQQHRHSATTTNFPKYRQNPRVYHWMISAGVCFALDLFTWHQSIMLIGVGIATLLANTQVFYLALYGVFFQKEPVTWRLILGSMLGLIGVGFLNNAQVEFEASHLLGMVLGCTTGFCYAGFILSLERAKNEAPHISGAHRLCLVSLVSAMVLGILTLSEHESMKWTHSNMMYLLLLGGGVHVVGWMWISAALSQIKISTVGMGILMQPLIASVIGWMVLGETLGSLQIFGMGLLLLGMTVVFLKSK